MIVYNVYRELLNYDIMISEKESVARVILKFLGQTELRDQAIHRLIDAICHIQNGPKIAGQFIFGIYLLRAQHPIPRVTGRWFVDYLDKALDELFGVMEFAEFNDLVVFLYSNYYQLSLVILE